MKGSPYIELLKHTLTDYHRMDQAEYRPLSSVKPSMKTRVLSKLDKFINLKGFRICKEVKSTREKRMVGEDWPVHADTMIGIKRLENIQYCFQQVIKENIPGDFIETGVWRGGSTIFMRALLKDANIPTEMFGLPILLKASQSRMKINTLQIRGINTINLKNWLFQLKR
jgi:O-methyltransferase